MALTQGSPLPNITTTQTQSTSAPSWYTDYLNNLATGATSAAQGAQFIGPTALQNQAFGAVQSNVGNYQPALTAATNMVSNAGNTTAPGVIDQYMSPYMANVVNQMGALGQRQINQTLAPGATAGAIGSGQFGSKRGAEVLGQTIRDANQNILAAQGQALNTGYQNAMTSAQADLQRQLQAGQQMGALAQQTQTQGLADVNALATLGGQQQKIAQDRELFPLETLNKAAEAVRGYSIPTSVNSSYTGPIPGAYSASPLQQIAGLGAILGGISDTAMGRAIQKSINDYFAGITPSPASSPSSPSSPGPTGPAHDEFGNDPAISPAPSSPGPTGPAHDEFGNDPSVIDWDIN